MIKIGFIPVMFLITAVWIIIRIFCAKKNNGVDPYREVQLLTVFICVSVIVRFTFFPWYTVDGLIQPLVFDPARMFPLRLNLDPFVHLFDEYEMAPFNLYGNILLFIPVGLIWPFCFSRINTWWKAVLAGAVFSLVIEILQLPFFDRGTDIDDLITNTFGCMIGAGVWFLAKAYIQRHGRMTVMSKNSGKV